VARLTRHEKVAAVSAGLLLGAVVALAGQVLGVGLIVQIPLCVIFAAGLGVFLASGKHGAW